MQVTTEVAWSSDLQADILEHALEMQPDVLLKQVEHDPVLKRAFFTPLDWQLLRHCPIPAFLLGADRPALPRQIVRCAGRTQALPAGPPGRGAE
jgi:universal stress protein E